MTTNEVMFFPSKAIFKKRKIKPSKTPYLVTCGKCKKDYKSALRNSGYNCTKCKRDEYPAIYRKLSKKLITKDTACTVCRLKNNVILHHIDCNKQNNEVENFIPLCRQCHLSLHSKHGEEKLKKSNIYDLFPTSVEYGKYGVRLRYDENTSFLSIIPRVCLTFKDHIFYKVSLLVEKLGKDLAKNT